MTKHAVDYSVIFADEQIVILNKRSGLLVAADRYDESAPRLDLIAQKEFGKLFAVHRIDKDTSGIIIYARTEEAHKNICAQFEERKVKKVYHCLVHGRPLWKETRVDLPLLPDGDARHRTVVNKKHGKLSITDFRVLGICGPYTWIEACPLTGRTHQIRAHLKASGLGIVCDSLYSGNQKPVLLSDIKRKWNGDVYEERPLLSRLALHAYKISFAHPITENQLNFTASYQKDMDSTRNQLFKIFGVDPLLNNDENQKEGIL